VGPSASIPSVSADWPRFIDEPGECAIHEADTRRRALLAARLALKHGMQRLCLVLTGNQKQDLARRIQHGKVSVIRSTGGGRVPGGLATTHRPVTRRDAAPGKREAVCPSSPSPSRIRSNCGGSRLSPIPKPRRAWPRTPLRRRRPFRGALVPERMPNWRRYLRQQGPLHHGEIAGMDHQPDEPLVSKEQIRVRPIDSAAAAWLCEHAVRLRGVEPPAKARHGAARVPGWLLRGLDDAIGRVRRQVVAVCEIVTARGMMFFLSSLLVRHSMPQPSTDWTLPSILVLERLAFGRDALHQLVPRLDERLGAFS